MSKNVFKGILAAGIIMATTGAVMASVSGTKTFTLSATVPAATGVSIIASSVNSTTNAFTTVSGTSLSFDPLTFDTTNSIFIPNHYFAIDVGPAGGGGSTDVTVTYTEGANPNATTGGSGHGLGWKAEGTFVKIAGGTETPLTSHGPKKLLKSLIGGEHVTLTELSGGTFRMYIGIVTNPTAAGEPAGAEVISAADKTGSYTGSLVVSATVS
jgi:hypothetical protein